MLSKGLFKIKLIVLISIIIIGISLTNCATSNAKTEANGEPIRYGSLKFGYKDTNGKILVDKIYSNARDFSEGLAAVAKGKFVYDLKWGFIDVTGKEVIPLQFPLALNFSEGLAAVLSDGDYLTGKWGFIDQTGNVVIPFLYDDVRGFIDVYDLANGFSEGLVGVKKDGKYGYINKSGNIVIPFDFDIAENFKNGVARVSRNGVVYSIDKTGNGVQNGLQFFSEDLKRVTQNGRFEYIDKNGVSHFSLYDDFEYVEIFTDGVAIVTNIENIQFGVSQVGVFTETSLGMYGNVSRNDLDRTVSRNYVPTITQGLIDKSGKVIIPVKKKQMIVRHDDGIFEIYEEFPMPWGSTFIKSTDKFYDSSGKRISKR